MEWNGDERGGREEDIKTFDDHEGINLLFRRRRTMIVFSEKGENDRVRLRGLFYFCVCERGHGDMLALSHTHTLS